MLNKERHSHSSYHDFKLSLNKNISTYIYLYTALIYATADRREEKNSKFSKEVSLGEQNELLKKSKKTLSHVLLLLFISFIHIFFCYFF